MTAEIRVAVEELYAMLGARTDRADATAADLFTTDGEFVAGATTLTGRVAIADHVSSLTGATTRHQVTRIMVKETGPDSYEVDASALIAVNRDGEAALVAADYTSHIVRMHDSLAFKRHEVAPVMRIKGAA